MNLQPPSSQIFHLTCWKLSWSPSDFSWGLMDRRQSPTRQDSLSAYPTTVPKAASSSSIKEVISQNHRFSELQSVFLSQRKKEATKGEGPTQGHMWKLREEWGWRPRTPDPLTFAFHSPALQQGPIDLYPPCHIRFPNEESLSTLISGSVDSTGTFSGNSSWRPSHSPRCAMSSSDVITSFWGGSFTWRQGEIIELASHW